MPLPLPHPMLRALLRQGSAAAHFVGQAQLQAAALARFENALKASEPLREPPLARLLQAPLSAAPAAWMARVADELTMPPVDGPAPPPGGDADAAFGATTDVTTGRRAGGGAVQPPRVAPSSVTGAGRVAMRHPPPPKPLPTPKGPLSAAQAGTRLRQRAAAAGASAAWQAPLLARAGDAPPARLAAALATRLPFGNTGESVPRLSRADAGTPMTRAADIAGRRGASPSASHDTLPPALRQLEAALARLAPAVAANAFTGAAQGGLTAVARLAGAAAWAAGQHAGAQPSLTGSAMPRRPIPRVAASARHPANAAAVMPPAGAAPGHPSPLDRPARGPGGLRGLAALAMTSAAAAAGGPPALAASGGDVDAGATPTTPPSARRADALPAALDDEQLAARLAHVLRRQAQRDGIDVDDLLT